MATEGCQELKYHHDDHPSTRSVLVRLQSLVESELARVEYMAGLSCYGSVAGDTAESGNNLPP